MKVTEDIQTNPAIAHRGFIDIYTPDDGGPHPFVLCIHGGGWRNGDHKAWGWMAEAMVAHGFAGVTCTYRLAQEALFPAAFDDLVALMQWLRTNGADHNLDPDRMAIIGGSAGGHLVCLLACRAPQGPDVATMRAVVGCCPVADTRKQFESDPANNLTVAIDFLGGTPDEVPQAYFDSSPLDHVHADVPPIMLIHGDADTVVWHEPTIAFADKLRTAGVETILHIVKGFGHGVVRDPEAPEDKPRLLYDKQIAAFFNDKLR